MNCENDRIGDRFEVVDPGSNHYHKKGDILELVDDQDHWAPDFKTLTPGNRYGEIHASSMDKLKPLEKTMDIKEAYKVMQANCGIEEGDTVKVLRKAKSREMGWRNIWSSSMSAYIGKEGIVRDLDDEYGIEISCKDGPSGFHLPFFVLEKVKSDAKPIYLNDDKDYKAEFMGEGKVRVGCQEIDFETIEKIYNTARSTRD